MTATAPERALTAGDVTRMLQRHYLPDGRPPGGILATEIGSPDGKRRADAIWMPTTIAGGRELVGHEIKVSRSDVLAELADPTKADPWCRYCTRWWLVVSDHALVDGLDIPEPWGIMAPPSGRRTRSMTVVRPAPRLTPVDPADGLRKLAAWIFYRDHERLSRSQQSLDYAQRRLDQAHQTIDSLRVQGAIKVDPRHERIARIVMAVESRATPGGERLWNGVADEDIVQGILDLTHAKAATLAMAREVERAKERFHSLFGPLRFVEEHLDKISATLTEAEPPSKG